MPRPGNRPAPPAGDQVGVTRAANRIRAAEWALTAGSRRIDLIAEIARLQGDIGRRRAELAEDESLLARRFGELVAIEKGEAAKAAAFGPANSLTLTLQEAAGLLRCSEATAVKIGERHSIGWVRDGRWRFSRVEVIAYVSGLPIEPV